MNRFNSNLNFYIQILFIDMTIFYFPDTTNKQWRRIRSNHRRSICKQEFFILKSLVIIFRSNPYRWTLLGIFSIKVIEWPARSQDLTSLDYFYYLFILWRWSNTTVIFHWRRNSTIFLCQFLHDSLKVSSLQ